MNITVTNLSFRYGSRTVLRAIGFSAEGGQLVALLGRNGAGKSTLFRLLLGMRHPAAGRIELNGRDISQISVKELAREVAYIPQAASGDFRFLVRDVVLMGTTSSFATLAMPQAEQVKRAADAMDTLGIGHFAKRPYTELSGGEQQLVLIARAIAQNTRCLVMDEPTASLDFGNQVKVMEIARKLARDGYLIFLSTHNPQHVLHYADRVLLLDNGRLVGDGKPRDVLTETVLSEIYDVPVHLSTGKNGQLAVLPALAGPMQKDPWRLYHELVDGVSETDIVRDVICGQYWTAVEADAGFGIAMSQHWPDPPNPAEFIGQSLKQVAEAVFSFNLGRAAVGLAAINCWYNRPDALAENGWEHPPGMYATEGFELKDRRFAMVGHLRHPDNMFDETKEFLIFEREPQPGDLPDTAEETMLPLMDIALVTGSTLSNKSLPRVLELLLRATVVVSGPSVPMCEALLDFGIDRIAGLVVTERDRLKAHILAGTPGPPFAFGRGFMISR